MAYPTGIKGRFFSILLTAALKHFGKYQTTLEPHLDPSDVACIVQLALHLGAIIAALNPPGPE